jgi:predicted component of type VI protein secretion system
MPKILIKFEAAVIKELSLDKPVITIGRKPDNDVVLDHPTVSSHHCKIYSAGDAWFVEDLSSTNGTSLNGKRVLKAGLRPNDVISIVSYSMVFSGDMRAPEAAASKDQPAASKPAQTASRQDTPLPQQKITPKAALEVLENPAGPITEFDLSAPSNYIGKSAQAQIPYKPGGLFGGGPDMAAVITMRPEGYYLTPVKEGYTKHNGDVLTGKVLLAGEDVLEVGATRFRFFIKKS